MRQALPASGWVILAVGQIIEVNVLNCHYTQETGGMEKHCLQCHRRAVSGTDDISV